MTEKKDEESEDENWIITLYQRYRELYGDPEKQGPGEKAS
jgi:hypothetical protein